MKRPGTATVFSVLTNILLSIWLVNNYYSDQYFRAYVNTAVLQIYPFLILTIGIGGGSSLGYLLLRRKHSAAIGGKLQKAKPTKLFPFPSSPTASLQTKNVPVGAPPAPASKHTAYAVPPLPKSSSQSTPKTTPSSSWSTMSKPSTTSPTSSQRQEPRAPPAAPPKQPPSGFIPSPRPESVPRQPSSPQSFSSIPRDEPSGRPFPNFEQPSQTPKLGPYPQESRSDSLTRTPPSSSPPSSGQEFKQLAFSKSTMDQTGKPGLGQQWHPGSTVFPEKSGDTQSYQKTFPDIPPRTTQTFPGQSGQGPGRPTQPPQMFPSSRPSPLDTTGKSDQWTDPVPKQGYSPPQKWTPPSVSPIPNNRPPQPMGGPVRSGQPPQSRPPYPPSQGPPRPIVFPGSGQPSPMRPMGPTTGPGSFLRPDQSRPPQGAGPQQRPQTPSQRSPPQQTPNATGEKKEGLSFSSQASTTPTSQAQTQTGSAETPILSSSQSESSTGEMDWDTALDTILKTLRKDKVEDKP